MKYIALDTETIPIGPYNVIPKLICAQVAVRTEERIEYKLLANYPRDRENVEAALTGILSEHHVIFHNAAFDLPVLIKEFPSLWEVVFQGLQDGRYHDTYLREKLYNLSTTGSLTFEPTPDSEDVGRRISYSLGSLVAKYLGEDRTADKTDEDSWRFHFDQLEGLPLAEYPQEAVDYAVQDAVDTLRVYEAQEDLGVPPTEDFQVAASVAFQFMTAWGLKCDQTMVAEVRERIESDLSHDKLPHLVESGVLRPEELPRPHKNNPLKLTKGKPESIDTKKLQFVVRKVCEDNNIPIVMTEPSKKFPEGQVSASSEVMDDIAHLHPILVNYQTRQNVQSILTRELPHMDGEIVHPCYDILKETGRTSSYHSDLYPSTNVQSKDPRIRPCFMARPGTVFYSVDYSAIELGSLAQKIYDLFGHSFLRELINDGHDPHAFLGSQLAYNIDSDFNTFSAGLQTEGIFDLFKSFATSQEEEKRKFFKHYRTFAKPTGLGYPGMLGVETFIKFAKSTYGIIVDFEMATKLKEIFFNIYPEIQEYFKWIETCCVDSENQGRYRYTSPLGMVRAGASICATANGAALQTPTSEGFKLAGYNLVRASYLESEGSCLYGTHPIAAIHDEYIGEIPEDEYMHERVLAVQEIMENSMALILPDVKISTEATLTRRWYKEAEPVFDSNGRLTIWEPEIITAS